ncbi:MAG: hypothetical protein HY882_13440 [Deltaproteobacteria bacterium]|nr:hypothetical protein [Deltaproteobacteria bacterium]
MIPAHVRKYLESRAISGPWKIAGITGGSFDSAVVIPALAEGDNLFATLQSVAQNPADILSRFLILVVVNNRSDAPLRDRIDNEHTLKRLAAGDPSLNCLQLAWVDASTTGLELPAKKGGVGLSRKIGFDLVLTRLNYGSASPPLISLDADTLVRSDYLPALTRHFLGAKAQGAVIPFCHQPGSTPEQDRAIRRYELFLRAYVLGLSRAGSPYAFHTVGSAMACTAEAYVRMGGMNTHIAGEDFYFLQHLARTAGIAQVKGTVVYPSARSSNRVPFGTGRSISRLIAKEERAVLFYQTACFQILEDWLVLVSENLESEAEEIRASAKKISVHLAVFLDNIKFIMMWGKLRKNFPDRSTLMSGFHGWFDGLKTMKLIHYLSAGPFPRGEPERAVPGLLQWAGLEPVEESDQQLALLRKIQIGEAY